MSLHATPMISSNIIAMLTDFCVEQSLRSLIAEGKQTNELMQANSGKFAKLSFGTEPSDDGLMDVVYYAGYEQIDSNGSKRLMTPIKIRLGRYKVNSNGSFTYYLLAGEHEVAEELYEMMKGSVNSSSLEEDTSANLVMHYNCSSIARSLHKFVNVSSSFPS